MHDEIIDKAFPGLSGEQRNRLKAASYWMDHGPLSQMRVRDYQHFMKSPGEDPAAAKAAAQQYIAEQISNAKNQQGWAPTDTSSIEKDALTSVGDAIHTATDGTSPAHVDSAGNPRDWNGLPISPSEVKAVAQHEAEEASPTERQLKNAIDAARQVFKDAFGTRACQQAANTSC